MDRPLLKCVACPELTTGRANFDDSGPDHISALPVCPECFGDRILRYGDDKFSKWVDQTVKMFQESNVAFESSGNLAKDREILEGHLNAEARIEDGICPNGCARMIQVEPGHQSCPVCKFHGFSTNLNAS